MSSPSRRLPSLIRRLKSTGDLLRLQSLITKTPREDLDCRSLAEFVSLSARFVSVNHARSFFDRLPSPVPTRVWNSMIRVYADPGRDASESVRVFAELVRTGAGPDKFTYPFVLKACARSAMVGEGETAFGSAVKLGFGSDSYVVNTLVSMYAACGEIGCARRAFEEMGVRNVVSWTAMIAGYVSGERSPEALTLFQQMIHEKVKPNSVTLVSLLSACARLGIPQTGKSIHSYAIKNPINLDVALCTALITMYAKCSHIDKAFHVFTLMESKNLQAWTIMITAFADHGRGMDAIDLFTKMEASSLRPDSLAFSSILSACGRLGLVEQGQRYFDRMVSVYGISPTVEHYGCIVDMFGRAGMVEAAYRVIKNMPFEPNPVILRSFLGACRKSHDKQFMIDEDLRRLLLELEPELGANYVAVANASAISDCWDDVVRIRRFMLQKGLKKVPGCSWVEGNNGRENVGCLH
ncbi:Pentatricopeptide repeat-containing protein [Acorus gramineus]|uniref:Pentatricopeptide repeat-containing protein n=1 Tax=Acorus gramineus TaxID=55184 RepID=A0AAV9AJ24_ACOGR|nr:Pentatricopeptide repeat-containing protein [Acorus gramineus]